MVEVIKNYKYKECFFEVDGPIATFTISNPAARNAYSQVTWEGLFNAVATVRADDKIRVLVLTGDPAGKSFCAGLNVKSRAEGMEARMKGEAAPTRVMDFTRGSQYYRMRESGGAIYGGGDTPISRYLWWEGQHNRGGYWMPRGLDMLRLPKMVIAMVNGPAVGAGCDLAFHCDIIVASDEARFFWAYLHRGFAIPAEGAAYFLPRLCGYQRTMEILSQGATLTAQQAYEWGLINHVIPHDQLKSYTYDLATRIATGSPPKQVGILKWAVQRMYHDFADNLERFEEEIIYPFNRILEGSHDSLEGNKAFVEKRKPRYTGT